MSLLGNIVRQNKKEAGGGGGGLTAANNGTSVSGTTVQLGQAIGAVGNPSLLLNDREIIMGNNSFTMKNAAGDRHLFIDPGVFYSLGDSGALTNGGSLTIDDTNEVIFAGFASATAGALLELEGGAFNRAKIGDVSLSFNQTLIQVDDGLERIDATINNNSFLRLDKPNELYILGDATTAGYPYLRMENTASKGISFVHDNGLRFFIGPTLGAYQFGDLQPTGNGMYLAIDDVNTEFTVNQGGNKFLNLRTGAGVYEIGDTDASANGTFLQIDDAAQSVIVKGGASDYLFIDIAGGGYKLGDISAAANGGQVFIDDALNQFSYSIGGNAYLLLSKADDEYWIGDFNGTNNTSYIKIDDDTADQSILLIALNGIQTTQPSATGAGKWKLGKRVAAAVAFDATQYIEVMIDGTLRKLALAA